MKGFVGIGTMAVVLFVCGGCGRGSAGVSVNGVPEDLVPVGFEAKECHFEDVPASAGDETRWQRLVCHHGP